ncbi:abortive infection system antitoxin AbiGi family protein [uncultured Empedobacter sp.]|uniref:abortive infection system antitoxin AbiGi family protein n=1 Tax=uncultured Empedobacter sp. TaxID=410844 RepID=UPI0025E716BD|nr:abortive infection system antitoxin AbiGi family protein [uncultured Empedobacter sp.]
MAISSNSVIHFTSKLENLKGILNSNGFRLKYCAEDLKFNKFNLPFANPMVCFCDIPLSEVKNHIDSYGCYGIGLYKKWAKDSELNPVLYIDEYSDTAKVIETAFERFLELYDKKVDVDNTILNAFFNLTQYCKNYEGPLKHGKINEEKYRFYNEREWRYIPNKEIVKDNDRTVFIKDYVKDKEGFNKKLENLYLEFEIEDISYIIVNDSDEIPEILSLLNDIFEDKCTAKQLKILGTKILTTNQIFNDF